MRIDSSMAKPEEGGTWCQRASVGLTEISSTSTAGRGQRRCTGPSPRRCPSAVNTGRCSDSSAGFPGIRRRACDPPRTRGPPVGAPCCPSPQQKSTPAVAPRRCPFPSAGTLRFSPAPWRLWRGDRAPSRCYAESLCKRSIRSTGRGKPVSGGSQSRSSECSLVGPLYLVATHVVTLVHDHRFATIVVLSDIQAACRALVLNLRQKQVKYVDGCYIETM